MKKSIIRIVSLILCMILLVLVSGCGSKSEEAAFRRYIERETVPDGDKTATKGFRVGFGRVEIMPEDSVPLRGYGNSLARMSTGFLDELYISCVAISDKNDKTLLLISVDLVGAESPVVDPIVRYASNKYNISSEYVHVTGTHTHSAPDVTMTSKRSLQNYILKLTKRSQEVIDIAMADRKVAKISAGETKTEGLNFDRHWWRADGTVVGDNSGMLSDAPIIGPVSQPDETMRLIKFTRKNSKGEAVKDVLLVNWQAHNHFTGSSEKTDISADFTSMCTREIEKAKNCYATYYQGYAGNYNEREGRFPEKNRTTDYQEYGKFLAEYAIKAYDKLESYEPGEVKAETKNFTYASNHKYDNLQAQAQQVLRLFDKIKSHTGIIDLCRQVGVHGYFHAGAILRHAKTGDTFTMPISVASIGDICFTFSPAEMFGEAGVDLRARSPYKFTFTLGYSDGHVGYIPVSKYYEFTCYEEYMSPYAQGASEKIVDQYIDMLNEIKGK